MCGGGAGPGRGLALGDGAGKLAVTARQPAARTRAWQRILALAKSWTPVVFPLKGRDVVSLGVTEGPEVGRLMRAVERWWVDGDFRPDRDACLAKLRALAGRS